MDQDLSALISFVLIATFTPGPNNISSASMGVNFGYRRTLNYLFGIFSGFVIIMLCCGLLADVLTEAVPQFQQVLSIVGAVYILYLAYHTFRASYRIEDEEAKPLSYVNGLLLQLLNPKAIIYGLTLYTGFLHDFNLGLTMLIISAVIFALVSFTSISTWTLFGSAISRFFSNQRFRIAVNTVLALLLVMTAAQISGLLH